VATGLSHFDVLVVDNAPSNDQARQVAMRWGVAYVLEPVPGLSRARNRGARASGTEIVAFLDDDSLPDAEWLATLAGPFKDPLVMLLRDVSLPSTSKRNPSCH